MRITEWTHVGDEADGLRRQAASCRDLAGRARTDNGAAAFVAVSRYFDDLATQLDRASGECA